MDILIIEDNKSDQQLLKCFLEQSSLDFDLRIADTYGIALELRTSFAPDIILLDLRLPDTKKNEIVKRCISDFDSTPIVVVSSDDDIDFASHSLHEGVQDFISKSQLSTHMLERTIRFSIERYQNHREVLRLSDLKSQFLANMSHEIRTPMNAILGMVEIMLEEELSTYDQDSLRVVGDSAKTLMRILNDVVDFSRIEAGKIFFESTSFEIRSLLEAEANLFRAQAKTKGLTIEWTCDDSVPSHILSDEHRLKQVISNLLSNAIKFTEEGGVKIHASKDKSFLKISVIDSGIGIPVSKHIQVFEKFMQADKSTARTFGGSGLGLTICKEIVVLMGGTMELVPVEDGCCFIFNIPLIEVSDEHEFSSPLTTSASSRDVDPNIRVLIVEDNGVNRQLFSSILSKVSLKADFAATGNDAVELALNRPYDLIFMDINLPDIDGFEVTQLIRKADIAQPKIVAVTANIQETAKKKSVEVGMDGFIGKPIRLQLIYDLLRKKSA